MAERGVTTPQIEATLRGFQLDVPPFDMTQAFDDIALRAWPRPLLLQLRLPGARSPSRRHRPHRRTCLGRDRRHRTDPLTCHHFDGANLLARTPAPRHSPAQREDTVAGFLKRDTGQAENSNPGACRHRAGRSLPDLARPRENRPPRNPTHRAGLWRRQLRRHRHL